MSPRLKAKAPEPTPVVAPAARPSRPLLRIEDVADRLQVSRSMAWKLVAYGDIRSIRIGRAVRVRQDDLESYIDAMTSAPA